MTIPRKNLRKKSPNLGKVSDFIRRKYANVFDTYKTDQLSLHQETDHMIDLITNITPSYQRIY